MQKSGIFSTSNPNNTIGGLDSAPNTLFRCLLFWAIQGIYATKNASQSQMHDPTLFLFFTSQCAIYILQIESTGMLALGLENPIS